MQSWLTGQKYKNFSLWSMVKARHGGAQDVEGWGMGTFPPD